MDEKEIAAGDLHAVRTLYTGAATQLDLCQWKGRENTLIVVRKKLLEGDFLRFKHRLTREISFLLNVNHENVISAFGYVHTATEFSLVMEYCKYESYHKHFVETNSARMRYEVEVVRLLPLKMRILKEIACGMEFLHSKPCLHLNLKAENVLLDENFKVKLSSFGKGGMKTFVTLSRSTSRYSKCYETSSLLYTAPEHLADLTIRATPKSDVYSFAVLAWQVLTDLRPYEATQEIIHPLLEEIQIKHKRPRLEKIPDCVTEDIIEMIKRCWNENPASRPEFREIKDDVSLLIMKESGFENAIGKSLSAAKTLIESPTWKAAKAMLPNEQGVCRVRYGNFDIALANTMNIRVIFPAYTCEAVDASTGTTHKATHTDSTLTSSKIALGRLIKVMVAKGIYPRPSDFADIDID